MKKDDLLRGVENQLNTATRLVVHQRARQPVIPGILMLNDAEGGQEQEDVEDEE
jgi:hypothetical protein